MTSIRKLNNSGKLHMLKPHLPNFGIMFVYRSTLKMIILYCLVIFYPLKPIWESESL